MRWKQVREVYLQMSLLSYLVFNRIYNVDVRELLFVEFTEAGDEQRLTAKYSSFLKLLEKLSDREVEDVYWVIKRKVEGLL
mgnify:CR=1 FL=1